MKKFKKIFTIVVTLLMSIVTLVGCGTPTTNDEYKGKLVIECGVFNGGYGYQWLENAASSFEQDYVDYKVGDLTGVKIRINPDRQAGGNVMDSINVTENDMYFTEQMSNWRDFIDLNYLLDITDVVTDPNPYGQGHSVVSSLKEGLAEMYGVPGVDGKLHYYTMPYANAFVGLTFDAELFYNKGLFLTKDYDDYGNEGKVDDYVISKIVTLPDGVNEYATLVTESGSTYYKTCLGDYLSMGPDGKYGTDDDGQAKTYNEFFNLCEYMLEEANVYPFVYGGNVENYANWLLDQLWADYSGYEQTKVNFTFDGKLTNLISVSTNGTITQLEDVLLVPDNSNGNAINITKTRGRYEALRFLSLMMQGDKKYMHDDCKTGYDQYRGQESFMLSKRDTVKGAYLMDGIWWENEATLQKTFEELEDSFGSTYNKKNRMFKLAALPKADISMVGEENTIVDTGYQMAFVFNSISEEKRDIAKKFLQFCFTDAMNKRFTTDTSLVRPFNYTLSADEEKQITPFGKSLMNRMAASNIVYPFSSSTYFLSRDESLTPHTMFYTNIDSYNYINIVEVIYEKGASLSDAFNGIYSYAQGVGL